MLISAQVGGRSALDLLIARAGVLWMYCIDSQTHATWLCDVVLRVRASTALIKLGYMPPRKTSRSGNALCGQLDQIEARGHHLPFVQPLAKRICGDS